MKERKNIDVLPISFRYKYNLDFNVQLLLLLLLCQQRCQISTSTLSSTNWVSTLLKQSNTKKKKEHLPAGGEMCKRKRLNFLVTTYG